MKQRKTTLTSTARGEALRKEAVRSYDKTGRKAKPKRLGYVELKNLDIESEIEALITLTAPVFIHQAVFFTWRPEMATRSEPNSRHVLATYLPFEFKLFPQQDKLVMDLIGYTYKIGNYLDEKSGNISKSTLKIIMAVIRKHSPSHTPIKLTALEEKVLSRLLLSK